jgi:hypothetical protein
MLVPYVGRHALPDTGATKTRKDEKLAHIVSVHMSANLAELLVR